MDGAINPSLVPDGIFGLEPVLNSVVNTNNKT